MTSLDFSQDSKQDSCPSRTWTSTCQIGRGYSGNDGWSGASQGPSISRWVEPQFPTKVRGDSRAWRCRGVFVEGFFLFHHILTKSLLTMPISFYRSPGEVRPPVNSSGGKLETKLHARFERSSDNWPPGNSAETSACEPVSSPSVSGQIVRPRSRKFGAQDWGWGYSATSCMSPAKSASACEVHQQRSTVVVH